MKSGITSSCHSEERDTGWIFWNFSQAWFAHSYLHSYIYCRLLIRTHLAHRRYLTIFPHQLSASLCTKRQKTSLLWKNLKHLMWNYLGGEWAQKSIKTTSLSFGVLLCLPVLPGTHKPEGRKRQLTPAHPLSRSPLVPTQWPWPRSSPDFASRCYFLWKKTTPFSSSSQRTS